MYKRQAIEENIAEISDSDEMQSLAKTIPDNEERNDSGIQTEAETTKEEEVPVDVYKRQICGDVRGNTLKRRNLFISELCGGYISGL